METKLIKLEGTENQINRAIEIIENRGCKWVEYNTTSFQQRLQTQKLEINKLSNENRELKQKIVDMEHAHIDSINRRDFQQKQEAYSPWHNTSKINKGMVFDVITSESAYDTGAQISKLVAEKREKGLELIEILQSACSVNHTEPYIITTLIYK